ncbi:RDD family protein [Mycoplasmatota bacterium WC30]
MYRKPVALRGVALFVDLLVIMVIGLILNALFGFGTLEVSSNNFYFHMNLWETTFVAILYFAILEYIFYGKTLGKAIFRLEVRCDDMTKITNRPILLLRGLTKGLLFITTIISWIIMLTRDDKKAIHDLVFKTIVVKKIKEFEIIEEKTNLYSDDFL